MTRDKRWQAKFSGFVSRWKQFLSLKNCRSVRICSVLNRSNRDTTVYYRLIFCVFSWPNMVKWHHSGIIKHCTWKGQRNWIHRIQDSSVIYYNVKAINGKDGMECFFCVLMLYQWPVKLIIDWSLQSTTTESGIYCMLWPNRPLGLFADFTVWTF